MNLSIMEKLNMIFKYVFSSFLPIGMLIITILLFIILIINLKRNNIIIQIASISIYLGFVIGVFISYTTYVQTCIDSFVKQIMNYVYFPSTIVYFFIMLFVTFMTLYTLFSKKMSIIKKIFNYFVFSFLYFFFVSFLSLCSYDMVDVIDTAKLYENNIILSIVQFSNAILLGWIIITGFYHLFLYFKRKFDKE